MLSRHPSRSWISPNADNSRELWVLSKAWISPLGRQTTPSPKAAQCCLRSWLWLSHQVDKHIDILLTWDNQSLPLEEIVLIIFLLLQYWSHFLLIFFKWNCSDQSLLFCACSFRFWWRKQLNTYTAQRSSWLSWLAADGLRLACGRSGNRALVGAQQKFGPLPSSSLKHLHNHQNVNCEVAPRFSASCAVCIFLTQAKPFLV